MNIEKKNDALGGQGDPAGSSITPCPLEIPEKVNTSQEEILQTNQSWIEDIVWALVAVQAALADIILILGVVIYGLSLPIGFGWETGVVSTGASILGLVVVRTPQYIPLIYAYYAASLLSISVAVLLSFRASTHVFQSILQIATPIATTAKVKKEATRVITVGVLVFIVAVAYVVCTICAMQRVRHKQKEGLAVRRRWRESDENSWLQSGSLASSASDSTGVGTSSRRGHRRVRSH